MPLLFQPLSSNHQIATSKLRELYQGTKWSPPNRSAYLIFDGSTEVGFVGFDLVPDFILYVVYVVPEHQNRGIGTETLLFAKHLAGSHRYKRMLVRPRSLSSPPKDVEPFYRNRGLSPTSNDSSLWECVLTEPAVTNQNA